VIILTRKNGDTYLIVVLVKMWRAGNMFSGKLEQWSMQVDLSKLLYIFWPNRQRTRSSAGQESRKHTSNSNLYGCVSPEG